MKEFEFSLNIVERLIDIAKKKDISKLKVKYKEFEVYIDLKEPILNMASSNLRAFEGEFSTKAGKENEKEEERMEGKLVVAPIVGTFYSKPSPDKEDFVKVGDKVKKGDVLFIIESMKLMNEVKSEFDGVVSKILVKSSDGVEYGQPIMILE